MERRPALGKGLSALIPDAPEPLATPVELDLDQLVPNVLQPRTQVDDGRLDDLAASIKSTGVIQPIIVRRAGERFQIIAGERRWRAAQRAGLLRVPVVVREVAEGQEALLLEMALIENIQRENLNPIDEALAYRKLSEQFHLTQEDIAAAVGRDRVTVANLQRLLKLPEDIKTQVASGALSMGHARALLALQAEADQRRAARDIVAGGLSVRQTEALVKKLAAPSRTSESRPSAPTDVHTRAAEDRLRLLFGTRVRVVRRGGRGRIEIDFTSEAELIRIYEQLTSRP